MPLPAHPPQCEMPRRQWGGLNSIKMAVTHSNQVCVLLSTETAPMKMCTAASASVTKGLGFPAWIEEVVG